MDDRRRLCVHLPFRHLTIDEPTADGSVCLLDKTEGAVWDVVSRRPFWSSFEHSRVPMCLVDGDRLVVASSEAAYELFGTSRDEAVGTDPGRRILDDDPALGDKLWQRLRHTNQLFAETCVAGADGRSLAMATNASQAEMIRLRSGIDSARSPSG